MEELLKAISRGKVWTDSFNRVSYENAFKQYCSRYEARFAGAVQIHSSVEELAHKLVDAIEESWRKERFWNRNLARTNDKLVLAFYLTPMLLASPEERCGELAAALCAAWNERFPDDRYITAGYEEIAGGFRNSVMGFLLGGGREDQK